MPNKKKALRTSPFDDAEIEASIFGGSVARPAHKESKPAKSKQIASKQASEQIDNKAVSQQVARVPMEKIMMRLPRSLATEFQQVYLQLAAWHLEAHGKKLYVQDCHIEAIRDWVEKQRAFFIK